MKRFGDCTYKISLPLSSSCPVSSHHPIVLPPTSSICSSSSLLSMLSKLPLPFPVTIVFLKLQRKFLKSPTQSSIQNAFLFLSGDIHSDNLPLQRSNVEWITPELSIESLIQCNKGQMSLKVKTFLSKSHCSKFPDLSLRTLKGSCFNKNVTLF